MWPMVAMAAASAIAQWMNSDEARKANAADRKRIEDLYNKIQDPNFDASQFRPEEFQVIGKYVPEAAAYVAEVNPTLVQETGDMKLGRQAQLDALRGLQRSAREERDPALMAQLDIASQRGQADAQSRQQSILQDAARRGQGSSANTLMAQLQGGASAQSRSADMQRQAAIEAYRNRMAALRDSADLGGNIRGQDVNMQQINMGAINAFNERTARGRQNYLNAVTGDRNEAQRMNLGVAQDIANKNVGGRNDAFKYNQGNYNDLQQRKLNTALDKAGGISGVGYKGIEARSQDTRDQNQAYQSLGDIGMTAYGDYTEGDRRQRLEEYRQKKEDERAAKYGYKI